MRIPNGPALLALASLMLLPAAPASAIGLLLPAVQAGIDEAELDFGQLKLEEDGGFGARFDGERCDGGAIPGANGLCEGGVAFNTLSLTASGSVFPFADLSMTVVDNGDPSVFTALLSITTSPIAGLADWTLTGEVTVPASQNIAGEVIPAGTTSGLFLDAFVNGGFFAGLGAGPVTQGPQAKTVPFGPIGGVFDCAPLGDCSSMALLIGFKGLGGGQTTTFSGRFDLNPATPIPLPAAAPMLLGGLGALALAGRRRARPAG
jgi:hypothetical protein